MKRILSLILVLAALAASCLVSRTPARAVTHGYVSGDANDDSSLNMKDVLLLRKTLAGAAESEPFYDYNADLDKDGTITMKDVLMLRKILAGA